MRQQSPDDRAEWLKRVRPVLHTIADEILGSAARADDVLLCTWQDWMTTDLGDIDDGVSSRRARGPAGARDVAHRRRIVARVRPGDSKCISRATYLSGLALRSSAYN